MKKENLKNIEGYILKKHANFAFINNVKKDEKFY